MCRRKLMFSESATPSIQLVKKRSKKSSLMMASQSWASQVIPIQEWEGGCKLHQHGNTLESMCYTSSKTMVQAVGATAVKRRVDCSVCLHQ